MESQKYITRKSSHGLFCLWNGVGREAIAIMCDILNMPPHCQPSSWNEHSQALYQAHKEAVEEKLSKHSESVST